jgi:hypothetical protein
MKIVCVGRSWTQPVGRPASAAEGFAAGLQRVSALFSGRLQGGVQRGPLECFVWVQKSW